MHPHRDLAIDGVSLEKKPLVTFALFAYKQEKFIREAVEAALAQDYQPLEIILSDDCSPDRTFDIMQEVLENYSGPHKVVLNRNQINLGQRGIGLHVNHVLSMSNGEVVVFAAGDDISLPQRTSMLVDIWIEAGRPNGSLHSAVEIISDNPEVAGRVVHGSSSFGDQTVIDCIRAGAKGVLGASHAITRNLYDLFGPLPEGTLFEDRTLAFRSLLAGTIIYYPGVLLKYRQHEGNLTDSAIFLDNNYWTRWVNGIVAKYQSFCADYQKFIADRDIDPLIMREINKGIRRALRSRAIVSESSLQRAIAAFHYSYDFMLSDRIAFILKRAGLEKTALYRLLSFIWKMCHAINRGI